MRYIVFLLVVVVSMGCGRARPPITPGESAALLAAEKWYKSQRINPKSVEFSAYPDGADWFVLIEYQPPTPGGDTLLRIDSKGNVIEALHGA